LRYPKFIVRLGDSLAKLIADIKAGLRFYDKHKENKITIDHEPPKNPEYRDIWIDTSHEYIPPTQYFTVFIIQGPHQTIKISDGIGEYVSNTKLEAKTPISVKVIPDEGYDASKPNLTHFVLSEDTVVEALTEPTKTMLRVDIRQVPHQTITAHYNGKDYTEPFMAEYGSEITFTVTADKNYYEGTLNYDRIDKLTESVIIRNVEPPRVQSYIVRINQSEHQRISVEYNGKAYYETFEIPMNVAHDYAVYIDADDGWNAGEIKEVKDKNKRGTTISASSASPIMKTITVEQYQNQNIWVYVTEPSGTVEVYKERFSITVPMNSHITTKVVAKNENWTPGVANIQEADITDNIIISATEATGSDEVHHSVDVLFDMNDPQDLHGTLKLITGDGRTINITHSDVIRLEENTEVRFELVIDNGYSNATVLSEYVLNKDISVRIKPSTIKRYKVQLQQSEGQTIYAMYNGQRYTAPFEAVYGSAITFGIESANAEDWTPGRLSITSIASLDRPITVTASSAERIMRYNLSVDFVSPDSHTRLKVIKDGTVLGTYNNDFTLTRVLHDTRFEFELSLDEGYRNDTVLDPITLTKDTRLEVKASRFKQFLITPTQTEGQTIYIVNKATGERYTEPTYVDYGTVVEFLLGKRNDVTGHYEAGTINYPTGYNNGIAVRGDITVTATPAKRYGVVNITLPAATNRVDSDDYLPKAQYTATYDGIDGIITFNNGNGRGSTKTFIAPYGKTVTIRSFGTPTGYNNQDDIAVKVADDNNVTIPAPTPRGFTITSNSSEANYFKIVATDTAGTKYQPSDTIPYGTRITLGIEPFDTDHTITEINSLPLYYSNKQNKYFTLPDTIMPITGYNTDPANGKLGIVITKDISAAAIVPTTGAYGVVNITVPPFSGVVDDDYLPHTSYVVSYQGLTTPLVFTNGNGKGGGAKFVAPFGANVTIRQSATIAGYDTIQDVTFTVGATNNITIPNPTPKTYLFTAHNVEDHYYRIIAIDETGHGYENGERIPYGTKVRFNVVPYDDDYTVVSMDGIDFNRSNTTNKTFLLPDTVKYLSGDENLYFVPVNTFKYVTNDIDTSVIDGDGNIPFTEVKFIDVTFEDPTKAWVETIKEARMAGIVYNQYNGLNKNKTIWVYNIPNIKLQITPAFAEDIKSPAYVIDRLDSPTYRIPITANTINIPAPKVKGYNVTLVQSPYQTIIANHNARDYTSNFMAENDLPLVVKYNNIDKDLFSPNIDIENYAGKSSYDFSNPTYRIETSNRDVKIISNPKFLWETTGMFSDSLRLGNSTIKETDKTKIDKIFNTGLVKDASMAFKRIDGESLDCTTFGTAMSSVNNLSSTFTYSNLGAINVSNWDTINVTNMSSTFTFCRNISKLDISKWNTSNVTNMSGMFYYCNSLNSLDVSKWDTSKVTNMSGMFQECSQIKTPLDVSKWDTSKVTTMKSMFKYCSSPSLDVSKWNTSSVTNMDRMFSDTEVTTLDVSKWDTSKVTTMSNMFRHSKVKNLDLSKWNISKVTNMDFMFTDSYSGITTINITNLDTSNVVNMEGMFNNCYNLTTITGIIDMKHCTTYDRMFTNCSNLTGVKVKNLPTDINTFCNLARIDKSKVIVVS
jgi:bacterial surface protein 26-residue repeat protein